MQTIDEYFSAATDSQVDEYNRIRGIVTDLLPNVEETMNYGIPTFKYHGKNLVHFGYFKDHVSLFPTPKPIDELKTELTEYKVSKGTIQYDEKQPIPDDLVKRLVLLSAENIKNTR